jgi:hypothetical protein
MKKAALLIAMILIPLTIFSQEDREYRTLFDKSETRISGMGGPFMQFTTVAGEFGHMMGGGGAVIINDFFFGGYGLGLTNAIPDYVNKDEYDAHLSLGHGGFWMGYTLFGDLPVHATFSSLIGWGEFSNILDNGYTPMNRDNIFVLVPTVEVELNLTRYFRIGAGLSYNFYSGVEGSHNYTSKDLSSLAGFLSFKFGWF